MSEIVSEALRPDATGTARRARFDLGQALRQAAPNAITLGNAMCGFGALVTLSGWNAEAGWWPIKLASWLILGAWVCDMLDGAVARMTGTTGKFGAALDSLCDVVGFGVAPAFLVGVLGVAAGWSPYFAWGAGAALLACVLIRLARFDAEDVADTGAGGHMFFRGFPSPAVGMTVAATGLTFAQAAQELGMGTFTRPELTGLNLAVASAIPFVAIVVGLLAVTTWRYPDLPKHYARRTAPWWHPVVVLVAAIGLGPGPALLGFFGLYALTGPLFGRRRRPAPGRTA
ncbi:MAG: CDP-alcohol phosphatidyltransferase family protein [Candidatus Sericytochromatia bacterium]|nr:CDP-alcohol phosphatidyltransferase family protein [Candidatus Sericytochromatia bacterium]